MARPGIAHLADRPVSELSGYLSGQGHGTSLIRRLLPTETGCSSSFTAAIRA